MTTKDEFEDRWRHLIIWPEFWHEFDAVLTEKLERIRELEAENRSLKNPCVEGLHCDCVHPLNLKIAELEAEVERLKDAMSWSEAKTEDENCRLRAALQNCIDNCDYCEPVARKALEKESSKVQL